MHQWPVFSFVVTICLPILLRCVLSSDDLRARSWCAVTVLNSRDGRPASIAPSKTSPFAVINHDGVREVQEGEEKQVRVGRAEQGGPATSMALEDESGPVVWRPPGRVAPHAELRAAQRRARSLTRA